MPLYNPSASGSVADGSITTAKFDADAAFMAHRIPTASLTVPADHTVVYVAFLQLNAGVDITIEAGADVLIC